MSEESKTVEVGKEFADKYYGTFSEVEMEKMMKRLHQVRPINEPFIRYINEDSIRHFARAVGDMNPLYLNPEHARQSRYGKLIAPPCVYFAIGWGSQDLRYGQGFPGVHAFHSGDDWYYHMPLYEGDEVHATKELDSFVEKKGRLAKKQYLHTSKLKYYNQDDQLVAVEYWPCFRSERTDAKKTAKYSDITKAKYTEDEIKQIDELIRTEEVRGAKTRYWEDVEIGEDAGHLLRGPLCVHDLITWLEGIGSAFVRSGQQWYQYRMQTPKIAIPDPRTGVPEPIERVHWDDFMAQQVGDPAAYDYGAQRGGWATHFFSNWTGDDGFLCELHYTFRGFLYLADYLHITGKVTDKWIGAKTGTGYVRIEMSSKDQRGRELMPGNGVIALPSHKNGPIQFPVDVLDDGRAE
jgi:acyl dehydratase